MSRDEIVAATREAIAATSQLAAHLRRLRDRIEPAFPVAGPTLAAWQDEERERLHALLRMFEQLHDLTSRRLFRGTLLLSGEDPAGSSARNLFRRLEGIGALESSEAWLDLATTRNLLVHDYPVNASQQAERANRAWQDLPVLLAATDRIIDFIRTEGLLG